MPSTIRLRKRRKDNESKPREEDFNRSKIERSVKAAGASAEVARRVANDVEESLRMRSSEEVRRAVLLRLRPEDENAARAFEQSQKAR